MTVLRPLFALALAFPMGVASQTVSIPAIADTGLREIYPTTSGGADARFRVGNTAARGGITRNRALLRFDVAGALPAGAEVTDVSLRLAVEQTIDLFMRVFELRRMLVSWEEEQATWNQRSEAASWAAPGGLAGSDFSAASSAATQVGRPGSYVWMSTPSMVADIRRWQTNASENFGWMVLINPEGVAGTARRFISRESAVNSPMLDISYRPPFRIDYAGVAGTNFCIKFTTTLNRSYVVQTRNGVASGEWLKLTNFPPAKVAEQVTVFDPLGSFQRYYRVEEVQPAQ